MNDNEFEQLLNLTEQLNLCERNKDSEGGDVLREYIFRVRNGFANFKPELMSILPKGWYLEYYEQDNDEPAMLSFIKSSLKNKESVTDGDLNEKDS